MGIPLVIAIIRAFPQFFKFLFKARMLFEKKVPNQKQVETVAKPVAPSPYLSVVRDELGFPIENSEGLYEPLYIENTYGQFLPSIGLIVEL